MRKIRSLLVALTILSFVFAIPAFAQQSSRNELMTTNNNRMNSFGTNSTTNNQMNGYNTNGNINANNYRTNAATDDNDFDWGWLGLIGLAGLYGLKSRNPERT